MESRLLVRPFTPERWPDVEAVFNSRGCSVARRCWCMFYRRSADVEPRPGVTRAQRNRADLRALAKSDPPAGLIAYRGKVPVGWISLGPREDYRRLARSPVMKPVDDQPVWSVICFVVPTEHRHQGVATAMLRAAQADAAGGAARSRRLTWFKPRRESPARPAGRAARATPPSRGSTPRPE